LESQLEHGVEMVLILLGWPAVGVSIVCFSAAVVRHSRAFAVTGCALALPMLLYLTLTPAFRYLAPLGLVGLGLATWRIRTARPLVTVSLLLPALTLVLVLAVAVATQ
jgi:hypothetical protein